MTTIELLQRNAAARPKTFDPETLSVEAVIATGTPVARRDVTGDFLEILDVAGADLARLNGASVLDSHRQDGISRVLGTVESSRVEGGEIVARIKFSKRADVAPFVADIKDGTIKHLSVGYEVLEWNEGTDAQTGKRTMTATKWEPVEVSFVPIPADRQAKVRQKKMTTKTNNKPPENRAATNRAIRELAIRSGAETYIADDLIDRSATIEEARAAILDDMLERSAPAIRTAAATNDDTMDNPEFRARAIGEALYLRANPAHQLSEPARAFVGLSLPEIGRDILRRQGVSTSGMVAATVITRALHSTSDFALALGDTVGRTLRDSYRATPSGVRMMARQTTANDFRAKSRIAIDAGSFKLEKVDEHGEFKSGTIAEAAESYAIGTYGRIFGITRQALVNDDIGAFTDLSRRLGQAAAAFEAQFLVDLLASGSGNGPAMSDGKALFHADHKNKAASGAALDETALTAARLAMRKQTGPGGDLISVTPKHVLIPADLETSTEKLLSDIQATKTGDVNAFASLVPVVESRLTNANRWYVTADPAEIDGLEFAYLAGAEGPQTETRSGFEVDGVEVKVRLDYGAGFVDWRGWYTNAGA